MEKKNFRFFESYKAGACLKLDILTHFVIHLFTKSRPKIDKKFIDSKVTHVTLRRIEILEFYFVNA